MSPDTDDGYRPPLNSGQWEISAATDRKMITAVRAIGRMGRTYVTVRNLHNSTDLAANAAGVALSELARAGYLGDAEEWASTYRVPEGFDAEAIEYEIRDGTAGKARTTETDTGTEGR